MEKPDIVKVVQDAGVALIKRQGRYVAVCPLHEDGAPSFVVYPDSNRFVCFGCQKSGDAYDFYQYLYNVDFPRAKEVLGGEENEYDRRKADRVKRFREWERRRYNELSEEYHLLRERIDMRGPEGLTESAMDIERQALVGYKLDVLSGKDDKAKLNLFKTESQRRMA